MRVNGRARVNARQPVAFAVCDKCGFRFSRTALNWTYEWAGMTLQNQRILTCDTCNDVPNPQLRVFIPPPDPLPVMNPRPDMSDMGNPVFLATDSGADLVGDESNPVIGQTDELVISNQ